MKALTIWQPWASLIMAGAKPYEFRSWPAPRSIVGRRIVIHAGAPKMDPREIKVLLWKLGRPNAHLTGLTGQAQLLCSILVLSDVEARR